MATPDFDIRSYFTPTNFTPGFSDGKAWYRPYRLAKLNLTNPSVDTIPEQYQYATIPSGGLVEGRDFEDGLRAPISFNNQDQSGIVITNSFTGGSYAQIIIETKSDRDFLEIMDNEGIFELPIRYGHMMPHINFPLGRTWDINLSQDGITWADPIMFRGQLSRAKPQILSDVKIAGQQDGDFRWTLEFMGWDALLLQNNPGVPLWHHRATLTTDTYHEAFTSDSTLTFNEAIDRVILWMNIGKPIKDFPIAFSYSHGDAPAYLETAIFSPIGQSLTGALTFINGNTAVSGSSTLFTSQLVVGQLICPDANSGEGVNGWGRIASITNDTNLVLTANYAGTSRTGAPSSVNVNTLTISETNDRDTWRILQDILDYAGGLEGLNNKYIPRCNTDGVITVEYGGFNKTESATENFRETEAVTYTDLGDGMYSVDVTTTIDFTMVKVPFTGTIDKSYYIKATLSKRIGITEGNPGGTGWEELFSIPNTGYEAVEYNPRNTHDKRFYTFAKQNAGRYKWDVDFQINPASGVTVDTTANAGYFASSPAYNLHPSNCEMDLTKLRTFARTRGACREKWDSVTNETTCPDFLALVCPDYYGCYPDPLVTTPFTDQLLTFTLGSNIVNGESSYPDGTLFLNEVEVGMGIQRNSYSTEWYVVTSIIDQNHLTIYPNWGHATTTGTATRREGINAQYGFMAQDVLRYDNISDISTRNTQCRLNSKRRFECALNTDSSIRDAMDVQLFFKNGWLVDKRGAYLEYYDSTKDENITFRCIEQTHVFKKKNIETTMRGFRV